MTILRRRLLSAVVMATLGFMPAIESVAQEFPVRPVRMMIGFPPGGALDIQARPLVQKMTQALGQLVIIENRPGASGVLAIGAVITAPADGYMLVFSASSITLLPSTMANLPYDIERDLAPISLTATGAAILVVHPSVPARNVKELITYAKANPGKLTFAAGGIGDVTHLRGELLKSMAQLDIVYVPYKGSGDATIATITGEVSLSFPSVAAALPFMLSNKLRALAVTSGKRSALVPDVPTLDESGVKGYDQKSWYGVWTRAGVPQNVIAKLNSAIATSVASPDLKEVLNKQGFDPESSTPAELASLVKREIAENARLLKMIGYKPQ